MRLPPKYFCTPKKWPIWLHKFLPKFFTVFTPDNWDKYIDTFQSPAQSQSQSQPPNGSYCKMLGLDLGKQKFSVGPPLTTSTM